MTEEEARARVAALVGSTATARLAQLAELVTEENERQNLIASSTIPQMWVRHLYDSVQLLTWASAPSSWLDVGTGGGFPGLAIACALDIPMILAEPRRRRADFLVSSAAKLGLAGVVVEQCRVEQLRARVDIVSARAVASVENLLRSTAHCARPGTRWLLPRGRLSPEELFDLRSRRDEMFHVEQSLSDEQGRILIVERTTP